MSDLADLREAFRSFVDERDWNQFHDPKSLILALVGEVGELAELFQWLPGDKAAALAGQDPLHTRAAEEMADVLIYLVGLASALNVDLAHAASQKLADAARRFPAAEHAGVAPYKAT